MEVIKCHLSRAKEKNFPFSFGLFLPWGGRTGLLHSPETARDFSPCLIAEVVFRRLKESFIVLLHRTKEFFSPLKLGL